MRRAVFFVILLCGIPSQLFAQRYYSPEVPRYEVGVQVDIHHLDGVGEWGGGLGFRLNYNFNEHVALDSELVYRRSEEHTSELQSHVNLVCRLLLEKKKKNIKKKNKYRKV